MNLNPARWIAAAAVCLWPIGLARAAEVTCCSHLFECFDAPTAQECGIFASVVASCDECVAPVPAASSISLALLAGLMLIAGVIVLKRRAMTPNGV